jgi:uncharacterized membrane-anchored protein
MSIIWALLYIAVAFWLITGIFVAIMVLWVLRFIWRSYRDITRMNEFAKPRKRKTIYS